MNKLDLDYQALLKDILENSVKKEDRTGTGTLSVFGRQIRHKMSDGFPLLTTKKMYMKGIITELLWFLRGDTNIKYLVDNDCHIWDGDAYKNYLKWFNEQSKVFVEQGIVREPWTKEQYIEQIKLGNVDSDLSELGPIYGKQWRSWGDGGYSEWVNSDGSGGHRTFFADTVDQIANLINDLKTNPDSRRLMVSAWNVGELDQMVLPPCHYGFQVYTRELSYQERSDLKNSSPYKYGKPANGKLIDERLLNSNNVPKRAISLMWNQRSVDTPLGLPFNIASYGLLLEILGKITNMVPDELISNLGDTHIYLNQIEGVKEQLTREPFELPKLIINDEFWPTESGECGVGPLDAQAVLRSFSNDAFCKCLMEEDIQLYNYKSHPKIHMPLSN